MQIINSYKKNNKVVLKIVLTIIGLIIGITTLFPFIFMISSSFKQLSKVFEFPFRLMPHPFTIKNYTDLFNPLYNFVGVYKNTIIMTVVTILFKCVFVTITAYSFARLRFKGRNILFMFFLTSLMIPGDVTIIQKYMLFKYYHITDSMLSLILPGTFDIYFVFMLRQFFLTLPVELSESAVIDGCSHFKVFYKIMLPLIKPALITMILFSFIWSWNDFINPYILITDQKKQMLSVGLQMFQIMQIQNYAMQMAAASLALIPIIVLFMFAQKHFIEGIASTGIKG